MKRPIVIFTIGYIIGIIWGLYCNYSIALFHIIILSMYFLLKIYTKKKNKFKLVSFKRYLRYVKIIFSIDTILLIIISSFISNIRFNTLEDKYNNLYQNISDIQAIGIIVSNGKENNYNITYKIKVEDVNGKNSKFKNTYLLLKVSKKINCSLKYGDKVKIRGHFIEPEVQRNYGGFSYKQYLKTQSIYGTINAEEVELGKNNCVNIVFIFSNNLFLKIKEKVEVILPDTIDELFLGIMLGYTDEIDEDIKLLFQYNNMSHILAVSGMHISYIMIGLVYILNKPIGKSKTKWVIIAVLVIYMFITGFTPSVVRAGIMGILIITSRLFYRKNDIWTSISISALIMLVVNPFIITHIGFLLSYGGTIGIIVFNKNVLILLDKMKYKDKKYKINKKIKKISKECREILAITISAQIMIMPIMVMNFNTAGLAFLVSCITISIIIGPIIILGFIAIVLSFISGKVLLIISYILNPLLYLLIYISRLCENLPLNHFYVITPDRVWVILYYFSIFIINYLLSIYFNQNLTVFQKRIKNIIEHFRFKSKKYHKKIGIYFLIIAVVLFGFEFIPKNLEINFLDVGQGDCTLVVTPYNKTILIDGGGILNDDFDVGKNTLIPYLLDRKIAKIDYIIISHFDQDHVRSDF